MINMARRRRTRRRVYAARRSPRTRYRTRTVYRRARRAAGGSMKPIIDGALAGIAGQLAGNFMGGFGQPIAHLGIGYFRKNNTLKTLGGIELGSMLGQRVGGMFGGNGTNGGGAY